MFPSLRLSAFRPTGSQPARFLINGIAAAAVHYAVLTLCLGPLGVNSAGISNFIAALFGISASFVGNRYFVFNARNERFLHQLARFWLLYAGLALLHGAVLLLWTDWAGLDYRIGFLVGAALQTVCTYFGAKQWVFTARS